MIKKRKLGKKQLIIFSGFVLIVVIYAYFQKHQTTDDIIIRATEIASQTNEVDQLINILDSLWKQSDSTSKILVELSDKRPTVLYDCYRNDTSFSEFVLPRKPFYGKLTSNDIITVYKYTSNYLLLQKFARGFNEKDYSLLFIKTGDANINPYSFINKNFSNWNTIAEVKNRWFLIANQ